MGANDEAIFGPAVNPAHERMTVDGVCPRCGDDQLWRDHANIGVGVIFGPYGCGCGWSEWQQYDAVYGDGAKFDEKGGYTDVHGGYWPSKNPATLLMKKDDPTPPVQGDKEG